MKKSTLKKSTQFEVIEEDFNEDEALEDIKKIEQEANPQGEGPVEEEEEKEKKIVNLKIKKLDPKLAGAKTFKSICHTWFIVKDKGVAIDWKKPLL